MKQLLSIKTALLFLTTGLVFMSCGDFLDRPPQDQLSTSQFYKTANDAKLAVLACYGPIQQVDWYGKSWMLTEIPSDNTEPGGNDPDFSPIDNFTVGADNVPNAQFWAQHYMTVARANQVLEFIPQIDMNVTQKNEILAEARFLRAFAYFDLVRIYGDVPIVLKVPTIADDLNVPRDPVSEVYDMIIEDLLIAKDVLPENYSGSDIGRATKGAASALLAKVYLTNRQFEEAMVEARIVIASGTYRLMDEFSENFNRSTSDNNAEVIFQVQYEGCGPVGTGNALQAFFAPWGQGITKASDGWGSQIPTGPSINSAGTTIQDIWDAKDRRKEPTIMTSGTMYPEINPEDGGYMYPTTSISRSNSNIKKYVIGGGSDVCFMTSPQNVHAIRYSDVLLTLAEASCARGGGLSTTPDVLEAFNMVRIRAGLEPVALLTSDLVLLERRLEFAFENQRWFDLLRSGKAIEILTLHGKQVKETNLLFPIPSEEIAINNMLEQNPGY